MCCGRCHDHKFDPITREDYYGLYAIFGNATFPYAGSEEFASKGFSRQHMVPLPPPGDAEPRMKAFQEKIKQLQADIGRVEKEDPLAQNVKEGNKQIEELKKQIEMLETEKKDVQTFKKQLLERTQKRDQTSKELEDRLKKMRADLRNLERPGLPADLPGA